MSDDDHPGFGPTSPAAPAGQPPPPRPAAPQSGPVQSGPVQSGVVQPAPVNPRDRATGWYEGPLPAAGLVPGPESIPRSLLRTALKALTALFVFGLGSFMLLIAIGGVIGAIGAAIGEGDAALDDDLSSSFFAGDEDSENVMLGVPITGVILGEGAGGGLLSAGNATYGYEIKEKLAAAAEREDIDGVVLLIDTPGGTIFGSRAINDGILDYRKATDKPVVAFVAGISASGGMYAMSAADTIIADHGTLIGSIGVIFGPFQEYTDVTEIDGGIFGGGVEAGRITSEFISAGRGKDVGNAWRPMTDEERAVLQKGVDNAYDEFVQVVSSGRGIAPDAIVNDIGALIFDEVTSVENGLIDEVANRDRAFERAAEIAGLPEGDWRIDRLDRADGGLFSGLGLEVPSGDAATRVEADASFAAARTLCARPTVLAFYGDPLTLCP